MYNGTFSNILSETIINRKKPLQFTDQIYPVEHIKINDKIAALTVMKEIPFEPGSVTKLICKCDCGTIKTISKTKIKFGRIKTCGNKICITNYLWPDRLSCHLRPRWVSHYKHDGLSYEDFYHLTQLPCKYCGCQSKLDDVLNFKTNGLDRIDSSKGHTLNNVVPCMWNM